MPHSPTSLLLDPPPPPESTTDCAASTKIFQPDAKHSNESNARHNRHVHSHNRCHQPALLSATDPADCRCRLIPRLSPRPLPPVADDKSFALDGADSPSHFEVLFYFLRAIIGYSLVCVANVLRAHLTCFPPLLPTSVSVSTDGTASTNTFHHGSSESAHTIESVTGHNRPLPSQNGCLRSALTAARQGHRQDRCIPCTSRPRQRLTLIPGQCSALDGSIALLVSYLHIKLVFHFLQMIDGFYLWLNDSINLVFGSAHRQFGRSSFSVLQSRVRRMPAFTLIAICTLTAPLCANCLVCNF